jgi:hypothetical protein
VVTVLLLVGALVLAFWMPGIGSTALLIGASLLCAVVSAWVHKGGLNLFGMLYWIGAGLIAAVDCLFPEAEILNGFIGVYFKPLEVLPAFAEASFPIVVLVLCGAVILAMIIAHVLVRWKTPDPDAEEV